MKNREELAVFTERLIKTREARGLSRSELAEACGVNLRAFAAYERNENKPKVAVLAKICEVLDVSADYLLGLTDLPNRQQPDPDLRPEQLSAAASISEIVYSIAELDASAPHARDCLPVILDIVGDLQELQLETENTYDDIREQHPAFVLDDYHDNKERRKIRVRSEQLQDPEAIDFTEGEDAFMLEIRQRVNETASNIAGMIIVDFCDQLTNSFD